MLYEDAPDYTDLGSRTLTARKEHFCYRCKEPIAPGSRYHRNTYILDGVFTIDKSHDECPRVARMVEGKKQELAKVDAELARMSDRDPMYRETVDYRDILLDDIAGLLNYGL